MGDAFHDRAAWRVIDPAGNVSTLKTFGGQTWAVRAVLAAGTEGLVVAWIGGERLRARIEELRLAGIIVDCAEEEEGSRFTLRSRVERLPRAI